MRPLFKDHVWSYDFVADRTHDGRPLRILTLIDEYSRECLTREYNEFRPHSALNYKPPA
ncbi:uncharacterized protein METZ01_LOCUS442167, partial [marine metagenome]